MKYVVAVVPLGWFVLTVNRLFFFALLTRRLKASRSSIVSVSALAITGTILTHLSSLFMNSTSIGLNLQNIKADKRIKPRKNHQEMTFFERQRLRTANSLYMYSTF